MALLFRLRRVLTLTNPSLLRHHRISSTSNSGAGDHPSLLRLRRIHTLPNPSSLLHHHHRLLSTSNNPSPSLLSEVREAINQLSVKKSKQSAASIDPSKEFNPTSSALDEKLEQLKASALSLKRRQDTDRRRLKELDDSRRPFNDEVEKIAREALNCPPLPDSPDMCEIPVDQFIALREKFKRLNENAVEIRQFSEVSTKSRLASLHEIEENLAEIRNDLPQEVWNELNEGLMRVKEKEVKNSQKIVKQMNHLLALYQEKISHIFEPGYCNNKG